MRWLALTLLVACWIAFMLLLAGCAQQPSLQATRTETCAKLVWWQKPDGSYRVNCDPRPDGNYNEEQQ